VVETVEKRVESRGADLGQVADQDEDAPSGLHAPSFCNAELNCMIQTQPRIRDDASAKSARQLPHIVIGCDDADPSGGQALGRYL
jgi:hypothetical protein